MDILMHISTVLFFSLFLIYIYKKANNKKAEIMKSASILERTFAPHPPPPPTEWWWDYVPLKGWNMVCSSELFCFCKTVVR